MLTAATTAHYEAPSDRVQEKSLVYVVLALIVILPRLAGMYSVDVFDDAFITFRYAQNLATGHGLVFNHGEHVLGTTTPLFAVWLTGAALLGIAIPVAAQLTGLASDVLTALLVYRHLSRDFGVFPSVGAVAVFAIDPYVVRVGVGGMESSLFVALSVLTITLILEKKTDIAFLVASVSVYVRPEAGLLWLTSLLALTFSHHRIDSRVRLWIIVGLIVAVAPLGLIYFYYGSVMPQSIASKARMPKETLAEVVRVFFFPGGSMAQSVLTLLAPLGLATAWRRSKFVRFSSMWAGLYFLAYVVARPQTWTWYALPVYAVTATLAGLGLALVAQRWASSCCQSSRQALIGAVGLSVCCALGMALWVGESPVRKHVFEPLRTWCAANTTGRETIAAGDVGAIGYYCNATIYDLAGLVWPDKHQFLSHLDVIAAKQPDYIFAEESSYWESLFDSRSDLRRQYQPLMRLSKSGRSDIGVLPGELATRWQQDYVLFGRLPGRPGATDTNTGNPARSSR